MMTPIQSGGEAVPSSRLGRRTFLKGAAVAVASPTVALANRSFEVGESIEQLIAAHHDAHEIASRADETAYVLWDTPDRVEPPHIAPNEVRNLVRPLGCSQLYNLDQINDVVDTFVRERRHHHEWMCVADDGETPIPMPKGRAAKLAEEIQIGEAERTKLVAEYESRQSAYRAWRLRSGVEAADAECDRLWEIKNDLVDRIMNFECVNISDVRLKPAWLVEQYGDELSSKVSFRIMRQFAAIGQEARG